MIRALYSAASGMTAQQMSIDTIANNPANANTAAHKARRTQVSGLSLYQNVVQPVHVLAGSQTIVPNGLQLGLRARALLTNTIVFTQGSFQETDNPLDPGDPGQRILPDQAAFGHDCLYSRGQFSDGRDRQHRRFQWKRDAAAESIFKRARNRLPSPPTEPSVSTLPNQSASQVAGQIQLANFINPGGLNAIGSGYFEADRCQRRSATLGVPRRVRKASARSSRGYTENSNVSVVEEFIKTISSQRAVRSQFQKSRKGRRPKCISRLITSPNETRLLSWR